MRISRAAGSAARGLSPPPEWIALEGIRSLYLTGVRDPLSIPPENYWLHSALAARQGITEIQVDLKIDYATNIELYPKFQAFFRESKVPILAIWGKNDPAFVPEGAHAFRRDDPNATVRLLDTGHFALVTHLDEIADAIRGWSSRPSPERLPGRRDAKRRATLLPSP